MVREPLAPLAESPGPVTLQEPCVTFVADQVMVELRPERTTVGLAASERAG